MRMAGTREASQAAFGWPPSGPDDATDAQRAEIAQRKGRPPASAAQRKGQPPASAAQPTEAEKQGKAFIATMEKLPNSSARATAALSPATRSFSSLRNTTNTFLAS